MSESSEGETLKASGPSAAQIKVGMEVRTIDGQRVGIVKDVEDKEFLLDRRLQRDLWVPISAVMAVEDYSGNFRGPVQPSAVVINVMGGHLDEQGWPHA